MVMFLDKPRFDPTSKAVGGGEATAAEIFDATRESMILGENANSELTALDQSYDERINVVKQATGVVLPNPVSSGAGTSTMTGYRVQPEEDPHDAFQRRLEELADEKPELRDVIKPDLPVIEDAKAKMLAAEKRFEDTWSRSSGGLTAWAARIGGGFYGALHDPVQIFTLGLGPTGKAATGAKGLLWMGLKQAAANAGTEAMIQPFVQQWRKKAGAEYGWGQATANVLGAGAFGFAMDVGGRSLFRAGRQAVGRPYLGPDEPGSGARLPDLPEGAPPSAPAPRIYRGPDPLPPLEALEQAARNAPEGSVLRRASEGDEDALRQLAAELGPDADPAIRRALDELEIEKMFTTPLHVDGGEHHANLARAVRGESGAPDLPVGDAIVAPVRRELAEIADESAGRALEIEGRKVDFRAVDPRQVTTDAANFQFKSGGDASGVTDRLRGVTRWDPVSAGKAIVFERADGQMVIADGHQRLGLAQRVAAEGQDAKLDAYVFREADGWTPEDVRAYAALKNMRESSGTSVDMAQVMRDRPDLIDGSLPLTDAKLREAAMLARLSPEAFDAVVAGRLPPPFAALIGESVADASRHRGLLDEMAAADLANTSQARLYLKQLMELPTTTETQMTLFGEESFTRTVLIERAQVLDSALKTLKADKRIFGLLGREADKIEGAPALGRDPVRAQSLERLMEAAAARLADAETRMKGALIGAKSVEIDVANLRRMHDKANKLRSGFDDRTGFRKAVDKLMFFGDPQDILDLRAERLEHRRDATMRTARQLQQDYDIAAAEVDGILQDLESLKTQRDIALGTRAPDTALAAPAGSRNILAREANQIKAERATQLADLIEKLATSRGPVATILNDAAASVARGLDPKLASRAFVDRIADTLERDGLPGLVRTEEAPKAELAPVRVDDPLGPEAKAQAEDINWALELNDEIMFAIRAFHGTPHDFDRFDMSKIGTGEGAQVFGHGLYFAEAEAVARKYQVDVSEQLARSDPIAHRVHRATETARTDKEALEFLRQRMDDAFHETDKAVYRQAVERFDEIVRKLRGQFYEVEIDVEPERLLDWDKPLSEQTKGIREKVAQILPAPPARGNWEIRSTDGAHVLMPKGHRIGDNELSVPLADIHQMDDGKWWVGSDTLAKEFKTVAAAKRAVEKYIDKTIKDLDKTTSGGLAYSVLEDAFGSREGASQALREAGIPGIRYLDQGSRDAGDGTRNIVVFDDALIKITKKNGKPVSAEERQAAVDAMFSLRAGQSPEQQKLLTQAAWQPTRETFQDMLDDDLVRGRKHFEGEALAVFDRMTEAMRATAKAAGDGDADAARAALGGALADAAELERLAPGSRTNLYTQYVRNAGRAHGVASDAQALAVPNATLHNTTLSTRAADQMASMRAEIDKAVAKSLPPGWRAEVRQSLVFGDLSEGIQKRNPGVPPSLEIEGTFDPYEKIIYVSLAALDPLERAYEEAGHALKFMRLVPEADYAILAAKAKEIGAREKFRIDERYGDLGRARWKDDPVRQEAALEEEAIMQMVAARARGDTFGRQANAILDRLIKFLRAVRDMLGVKGFRTFEDVFEDMTEGGFARQMEAQRGSAGAGRHAAEADEPDPELRFEGAAEAKAALDKALADTDYKAYFDESPEDYQRVLDEVLKGNSPQRALARFEEQADEAYFREEEEAHRRYSSPKPVQEAKSLDELMDMVGAEEVDLARVAPANNEIDRGVGGNINEAISAGSLQGYVVSGDGKIFDITSARVQSQQEIEDAAQALRHVGLRDMYEAYSAETIAEHGGRIDDGLAEITYRAWAEDTPSISVRFLNGVSRQALSKVKLIAKKFGFKGNDLLFRNNDGVGEIISVGPEQRQTLVKEGWRPVPERASETGLRLVSTETPFALPQSPTAADASFIARAQAASEIMFALGDEGKAKAPEKGGEAKPAPERPAEGKAPAKTAAPSLPGGRESKRIRNLINQAAAEGKLPREDADALIQRFDMLEAFHKDGGKAKQQIAKELDAEAEHRKRQKALAEGRRRAIVSMLTGFRDARGQADPAKAMQALIENLGQFELPQGFVDVAGHQRAIYGLALADLDAMLHEFRKTLITGTTRNKAQLANVVRELHGEATGDELAAGFAQTTAKVMEDLRLRFNAAGGNIAKRKDWHMPQSHDKVALLRGGRDAKKNWIEFTLPLLDLKWMKHPLTGDDMPPAEVRKMLGDVWENLVSDGWHEREATMSRHGVSAIANTRADPRSLIFANADAWMKYSARYGSGDDALATIVSHIRGMTKDIAAMEVLGPNPTAMLEYLRQFVVQQASLRRAGMPAHFPTVREITGLEFKPGSRFRDPLAYANVMTKRAENMWRIYTGAASAPESPGWAETMATIRNVNVATKLGGAFVSGLGDPFWQIAARKFAGLPATKIIGDMVRQIAPGGEREARRSGVIAETFLHMHNEGAREGAAWSASKVSGYVADRVLTLSMLNGLTRAGNHAMSMGIQGHLADMAGKAFADLDPRLQRMFRRWGLEATDWDAIRLDAGGRPREVDFLSPADIRRQLVDNGGDPSIAERYLAMTLGEAQYATLTGSITAQARVYGNMQAGTAQRELWSMFMQFKSFAVNLALLQLSRMAREFVSQGFSRGAQYAFLAFGMATLGGALVEQLQQLRNGKDPRAMNTWEFWGSAAYRSGGMSIWGDLLYASENRFGGGVASTLAGPSASTLNDILNLTYGSAKKTILFSEEKEKTNFGRQLSSAISRYTPGSSIWYVRAAWERALMDNLQRMLDPEAEASFRRKIQNIRRDYKQEYWWKPGGGFAPQRGPRLGAAFPAR